MTKIKINNESLMVWWLLKSTCNTNENLNRQIIDKITENSNDRKNFLKLLLHNKTIIMKGENISGEDILNIIILPYPYRFDIDKTQIQSINNLPDIIISLSIENWARISSRLFSNPLYEIEDLKKLMYQFFDKCYDFFSQRIQEFPMQAAFWKRWKEEEFHKKTDEEQYRMRCMLLAQNPSSVASFLNPIVLDALEEKLKELEK